MHRERRTLVWSGLTGSPKLPRTSARSRLWHARPARGRQWRVGVLGLLDDGIGQVASAGPLERGDDIPTAADTCAWINGCSIASSGSTGGSAIGAPSNLRSTARGLAGGEPWPELGAVLRPTATALSDDSW